MFEGIIANLLNSYLGKYIQNLDKENLQIGILDGVYKISNIYLISIEMFVYLVCTVLCVLIEQGLQFQGEQFTFKAGTGRMSVEDFCPTPV